MQVVRLADALQSNAQVERLNLSANYAGLDGARRACLRWCFQRIRSARASKNTSLLKLIFVRQLLVQAPASRGVSGLFRVHSLGRDGALDRALARAISGGRSALRELNLSDNVLVGRYLSDKGQTYAEQQLQTAPDGDGVVALLRCAAADATLRARCQPPASAPSLLHE